MLLPVLFSFYLWKKWCYLKFFFSMPQMVHSLFTELQCQQRRSGVWRACGLYCNQLSHLDRQPVCTNMGLGEDRKVGLNWPNSLHFFFELWLAVIGPGTPCTALNYQPNIREMCWWTQHGMYLVLPDRNLWGISVHQGNFWKILQYLSLFIHGCNPETLPGQCPQLQKPLRSFLSGSKHIM